MRFWPIAIAAFAIVSAEAKVVVYSGATLIDGTGSSGQPNMAIVTEDERITRICPAADLQAPAGAELVSVKDQFVLPGLINSHEHLATPPDRKFAEAVMRRDLYGGVTAVRCMGDDLRSLNELARAARLHEIAGPDIYSAALFAGRQFFKDPRPIACTQGAVSGQTPWMRAITDETDLTEAVTLARGAGAIAIKIYADLSPELVRRIVEEAHRQSMQAWAHSMVFPATPSEVVAAGPDTVSHVGYLPYEAINPRPFLYEEREKFPTDPAPFVDGNNPVLTQLFAEMKRKNIILDATTYVYGTIERMRARDPKNAPPPPFCSFALAKVVAAQAYRAGVLISVGTDSFAEREDPYPAVQGEMEILMRDIGMKPLEAIRSATLIGAMSMRQEKEMGTIEAGKLANFVFVSSDPEKDIGALRHVTLTVKRGVRYPRKAFRPITKSEAAGRL